MQYKKSKQIIDDVHAVANLAQIAEAIEANDAAQLETLLLLNATTFAFDDIDVVNTAGERIVVTSVEAGSSLCRRR